MIQTLKVGELYSRQDVHDIFDHKSPFRPGTGTWGIQGIVKIPASKADFAFFVTFGQSQSNHIFDETISDGVLTWQSQPKQKLGDPVIQDLINHNHLVNKIYLFLRDKKLDPLTRKAMPFTYLGRLAYISHDEKLEQPVHFKWKIINS